MYGLACGFLIFPEVARLGNYWRGGSLSYQSGTLYQRRTLAKTAIDLNTVSEARWYVAPRGMILLRTPGNRILIDCNILEPSDALWLIRLIRSRLPESIQTGWPLFAYRVAVPLREGRPIDRYSSDTNDPFVKRLQGDMLIAAFVLLTGTGGAFLSAMLRQPMTLLAPLVPALFWIGIRFIRSRESQSTGRRILDGDLAFLSLLLVLSLITFGVDSVCWSIQAGLVA